MAAPSATEGVRSLGSGLCIPVQGLETTLSDHIEKRVLRMGATNTHDARNAHTVIRHSARVTAVNRFNVLAVQGQVNRECDRGDGQTRVSVFEQKCNWHGLNFLTSSNTPGRTLRIHCTQQCSKREMRKVKKSLMDATDSEVYQPTDSEVYQLK